MTFAIFIVLILGLFIAGLNVLPTAASLGFSFEPAVETLIGYMNAWNWMFPVHELLICVGIVIAYEVAVWVWHVLWRVIKFIRGSSDGS